MHWTSSTQRAILASDPRIQGVSHLRGVANGLGTAVVFTLELDGAQSLDRELLMAALATTWQHTDFEPNAIRVRARDLASGEPIALMEVAGEISDMITQTGNQGVSFIGLSDLLGVHPSSS